MKKVICIAVALFFNYSFAEARDIYAGVGVGESDIDLSIGLFTDGSLTGAADDTKSLATRVFVGTDVGDLFGEKHLPLVSVEAGIIDGIETNLSSEASGGGSLWQNAGPVSVKHHFDGKYGAVIIKPKLNENLRANIKVGIFSWDAEMTMNDSGGTFDTITGSGTDTLYGLGLQYKNGAFGARLEYEMATLDTVDLTMTSLSFLYYFED